MADWISRGDRLPVPVTAYGPLHLLARQVHRLANTGQPHEAITAADAFLVIARTVRDEKTIRLLTQGKMYALLAMGRYVEATMLGEELLRTAGSLLNEAKTLCDLAQLHLLRGHYVDCMRNLARAGVLLNAGPAGTDRHRSAMCSFAEAATVAEMYETAAIAYDQLCADDSPNRSTSFDLVHAVTLLYWGLRLAHVGRSEESRSRLRRSAEITRSRLDDQPDLQVMAVHALALAKLGETTVAEKLAREAVLPLRTGETYQYARMAHLALGISLRAHGLLHEARREFIAARDLSEHGCRPDERPIIRFELALTALELDNGQSSRDLFETVEGQVRELWRLRLQRLAMLRQAGQREEAEAARARAEHEVMLDPLTGLGNRRKFDLLLDTVDAGRDRGPLTLLLIDVDHFKAVNDAYSHSAGDRALREVATILRAHCRTGDEAVRYAGDEFVVFLRGDSTAGRDVAERIRTAVAAATILPEARLTVSIGVATWSPALTGDALFRAADDRLYAAKWSGRNTTAA
ncbi:GGDEF domain-containing protein [Actinoplanes friuliensis]|uniref:Cellulose synthesis regulatory protein n=1 Tax=Actinoplanes friuliensis DSM 7358 TaxID=1246995 RepID=U5VPL8_9ACTN|nr:GGDEF domain-containing protein [Actinoplanes friuliensis]AGZ38757.1 Cellulose synthesis regulatory protein [Actinoplanes friuliensis DSM 7358]